MIAGALEFGIVGRALERGLLEVGTEDPRAHTEDVHRTVDDRPYGGGPGMVHEARAAAGGDPRRACAAAAGEPADLPVARRASRSARRRRSELAALPGLLLVAGRYEGVDERVVELGIDRELSVGDYVLSGGELPALVVIDAVARLLPGALGDERSSVEDSFVQGLLDWPHYTRPEVFEGLSVPPVLLSGDHAGIRRWRLEQAVERTWRRRPELLSDVPACAGGAARVGRAARRACGGRHRSR